VGGTYYRRVISESGFASKTSKISEAWQRGDKDGATYAVTEQLAANAALVTSINEGPEKLDELR